MFLKRRSMLQLVVVANVLERLLASLLVSCSQVYQEKAIIKGGLWVLKGQLPDLRLVSSSWRTGGFLSENRPIARPMPLFAPVTTAMREKDMLGDGMSCAHRGNVHKLD